MCRLCGCLSAAQLFIVLDDLDDEHNSKIAQHVLRLHRFALPGQEGEPTPIGNSRNRGLGDDGLQPLPETVADKEKDGDDVDAENRPVVCGAVVRCGGANV